MAEGDVEVELKEEPLEEPKLGETPARREPTPEDNIDQGLAELQRKLDEAEQRATAAEQRATTATQRASQIEKGAIDDRLITIQSALDTIDANVATLQTQMADAMAAGDFAKHSELNVALAKQLAAQPDLLRGKAALEQQAKQPAPRTVADLSDSEKVDLYVANMQPRAAGWIRAHPQYVTDPKLNVTLNKHHYAAMEAGHTLGTDGYFRFMEDSLAIPQGNGHAAPVPIPTPAPVSDATAAAAQVVRRRDEAQPPAAAPSRGGGGARTIRLTKDQQDAAAMSGLTNEQYAQLMERERKAGNIGKPH